MGTNCVNDIRLKLRTCMLLDLAFPLSRTTHLGLVNVQKHNGAWMWLSNLLAEVVGTYNQRSLCAKGFLIIKSRKGR